MKEKLTNVSVALFEKKGFSQTSIQDIVNELNVTKGTFYYYFPSKEKLLMDIHLDYITHLLNRQELIINNKEKLCKEKLEEIVEMLIFDISDKGSSGLVFFREVRHLINVNIDIIKAKRDKFRFNIEKVIEQGVKSGEFRSDLQVSLITFGILGITNYSYNWFDPNGKISSEELVSIYRDFILHGIANNNNPSN